jgi:predicted NAD/FAD-dependent oxidoreductase
MPRPTGRRRISRKRPRRSRHRCWRHFATSPAAAPSSRPTQAHRWRYALVTEPVGEAALYDRPSGIGLCGDWCLGGKIEAAFLSGRALVEKMLAESAEGQP